MWFKKFDGCVQKVCEINAKQMKTTTNGVIVEVLHNQPEKEQRELNASEITIYLFS